MHDTSSAVHPSMHAACQERQIHVLTASCAELFSPEHGCVPAQAVKRLLRNCGSRDVTLFEVPGGYHELFMGPEKELVMQRLIAWVLEHAALKSAQAS